MTVTPTALQEDGKKDNDSELDNKVLNDNDAESTEPVEDEEDSLVPEVPEKKIHLQQMMKQKICL